MNSDVFISYSFKKDRVVAEDVCRTLEGFGIRCWIAPRDEDPGISYEEQIESAIKSVKVVVLVSSSGANESIHVQNEIACAATASNIAAIVPFRIEDFEYCNKLSYYLRSVHWLDAFPDYKVALTPLVHKVKSLIDRATEPQAVMEVNSKASERIEQSLEDKHGNINEIALPVLGKAVDEVSLTGLTGEDAKHFKKAMGYYRVLRRRSALEELQKIKKQDDPIVRYYVLRFKYELDGTVSDDELEEACCAARDLGCTDAMVAFAEMHLLNDDKTFDTVLPSECIDWLKKAIEKGNVDALMQLGVAYERGKGCVKDVSLARQLVQKASDSGSMRGKFAYGIDLLTGECGEKDVGNAITILTPLVDHLQHYEDELTVDEHACLALFYLGQGANDMDLVWKHFKLVTESNGHSLSDNKYILEFAYYFMGQKLLDDAANTDNAKLAIDYFHKAINIGVKGSGELGLAVCYDNGYGVERDDKKSLEFYQKAAGKGNGEAQVILAGILLNDEKHQDVEKGKTWLKLAAEGGEATAERLYGLSLIAGEYFQEDIAEGMKWLEKAAKQGCADAMNDLGEQYRDGNEVVEVNSEKAFDWFKRGADAGSLEAMESLGLAYLYGTGTVPDMEEAKKWLSKAADNGNASAMCSLGTRYFKGDFGERDVPRAIEWWEKAAEHEDGGDSIAMLNLGTTYRDGAEGVEKNPDKAVEWLTKASDAGNEDAARILGVGYYNGDFGKPDMKMALKWWQKAAKLGDATAMNNIGEMYRDGEVVEEDFGKAIDWFKRAANCKPPSATAIRNLGEMYLEGKGVEKDAKEAEKWYCKAADTDDSDTGDGDVFDLWTDLGTKYYNGDFGEPNYKEAKKWWERASEHGNSTAMFKLATSYRGGDFGEKDTAQWIYWVERSIDNGYAEAMEAYAIYLLENGEEEKCRELLEKSAENGNASAMCSLGTRYFKGDFGERDVPRAIEWWEKAAEHEDGGDSIAMLNLGTTYRDGAEGVEKNPDKAVEWLTKASDAGNEDAACVLGTGYYNGTFGKPNMEKALKWWQKAAKLGDATAMNNIGEMYRDGEVVEEDFGKAIDWFKRAANCESPSATAMCNLGEMYLEGKGVEKDAKEAEKWYCKAADTDDSDTGDGDVFDLWTDLGTKYYNGDFGEPDYKEAKKWWEQASEHGNSTAMFNLATSYRGGDFGEKDTAQWIYWVERSIDNGNAEAMEAYAIYLLDNGEEEKSRELFERAAENGNASAMRLLGDKYFEGDFGEKNVAKAIEWWTKAAEHEDGGDSEAMFKLGTTYCCGADGVEEDDDKAFEWLAKAVKAGHGYGCVIMGLRYLSLLDIDFDSYGQFAKTVTESFDDEQARTRAIRKAKGMFNKAIASDDPDAIGYGHLFLARIAKLQGDAEMASAHYAKAEEYGIKERAASSLFARILNSVSFLKKN